MAMPWSPSLLSPRSSSCSEALEATTPHRSLQLAGVRPQFSSLGAQGGRQNWEAPVVPSPRQTPHLLERLQLAGRVHQAPTQHLHASLADVVVAHHKLLDVPPGPEHCGQGLTAGGRQVAVLQPGDRWVLGTLAEGARSGSPLPPRAAGRMRLEGCWAKGPSPCTVGAQGRLEAGRQPRAPP